MLQVAPKVMMNLYHTRSVFSLIPKLLDSCPMTYFFNIWGGGRVIILFGFVVVVLYLMVGLVFCFDFFDYQAVY